MIFPTRLDMIDQETGQGNQTMISPALKGCIVRGTMTKIVRHPVVGTALVDLSSIHLPIQARVLNWQPTDFLEYPKIRVVFPGMLLINLIRTDNSIARS